MAKEESNNNGAIYVLALVAIVAIVALVLGMNQQSASTPVYIDDGYGVYEVDEQGNIVGDARAKQAAKTTTKDRTALARKL